MNIVIRIILLVFVNIVNAGDFDETYNLPTRNTMVHLFEWKWTDIANECEKYLSKHGFGTVQVFFDFCSKLFFSRFHLRWNTLPLSTIPIIYPGMLGINRLVIN